MAKIQLMTLDCSRVDYNNKDDDKSKADRPIVIDDDSIRLNEESLRLRMDKLKENTLVLEDSIDITDKFK